MNGRKRDGKEPPLGGRGAVSNRSGRFERYSVDPVDTRETQAADEVGEPTSPSGTTTVVPERTRRILTRNDSPDVPFDVSINPYKGCEHGCVYCFARPTHTYLGLSAGTDFETRIFSKPKAHILLRRELDKPGYRVEPIALGANTDPYQPVERELGITRRILETLYEYRHPVGIVTKSSLVVRDLDILGEMAALGLAHVHISLTTLDRDLARRMEPRASTPRQRLQAITEAARASVPVGVLASPMIPGLNDSELENILKAARDAGAESAGYILLRLPLEVRRLFEEWLETHYPLRVKHVLNLVRDTREGALYDTRYGKRMSGTGAYAELLRRRFETGCSRLGLTESPRALDRSHFRRPCGRTGQLDLFGRETER